MNQLPIVDQPQQADLFNLLELLVNAKLLNILDVQFSRWLAKTVTTAKPKSLFLAALVSNDLAKGHVCIDLSALEDKFATWPQDLAVKARELLFTDSVVNDNTLAAASASFKHINYASLNDQLLIGDGSIMSPLVLDKQRLYLYRYWQYECQVAASFLRSSAQDVDNLIAPQKLKEQLDFYFHSDELPDWQRIAAAVTCDRMLSIISGGPGTGKTTTVTKLLAIYLQNQLAKNSRTRIELAAPTGKAAARLSESIAAAKVSLKLPEEIVSLIPEQGKTIHRLLGVRGKNGGFIHNEHNPLLADLVIIDEASMIDLPMMASIVAALASNTRLVLIGDRDQLASVEAGSVLGDICDSPAQHCYSQFQSQRLVAHSNFHVEALSPYAFSDSVTFLKKSYRFAHNSGIGILARACNQGNTAQISTIVKQQYSDLEFIAIGEQRELLLKQILTGYAAYIDLIQQGESDPRKMLLAFNDFQILCALRVGFFGVENINSLLEKHFENTSVKSVDNRWYNGRPIMITQNDHHMGLYNGDIGVACTDSVSGQLKVWFEQAGDIRGVLPSRLTAHETVFAMTVHKSQGSEFKRVMFFVAQGAGINKELIYTAITRAKQHFSYCGTVSLLKQAIGRSTQRVSGLADKIWQS